MLVVFENDKKVEVVVFKIEVEDDVANLDFKHAHNYLVEVFNERENLICNGNKKDYF